MFHFKITWVKDGAALFNDEFHSNLTSCFWWCYDCSTFSFFSKLPIVKTWQKRRTDNECTIAIFMMMAGWCFLFVASWRNLFYQRLYIEASWRWKLDCFTQRACMWLLARTSIVPHLCFGTEEEIKLLKLHVCNQNTIFYRNNKSKQMKSRVENKRWKTWVGLNERSQKQELCADEAPTRNLKSLFIGTSCQRIFHVADIAVHHLLLMSKALRNDLLKH